MAHLISKEKTVNWLNSKGLGVSACKAADLRVFTEMGHEDYIKVGELEDEIDLTIVKTLLSEVTSIIITEYTK